MFRFWFCLEERWIPGLKGSGPRGVHNHVRFKTLMLVLPHSRVSPREFSVACKCLCALLLFICRETTLIRLIKLSFQLVALGLALNATITCNLAKVAIV